MRTRIREQADASGGFCVLTGGQTGVDTAAAIAALRHHLPVHLVFPRGLLQEDGPIGVSRLERLRGSRIHELGSARFSDRTWVCAYIADAVILIDPAGGDGCRETVRAARRLGRPLLDLSRIIHAGAEVIGEARGDLPGAPHGGAGRDASDKRRVIGAWLESVRPRVLMVAGCRGGLLTAAGQHQGAARLADDVGRVAALLRRGGQ